VGAFFWGTRLVCAWAGEAHVPVVPSTDAVVKVFVTSNSIDYYRPWQSKGIASAVGSGVILPGHKILTNAHVVADHTFIQVKKEADPKKYTARVEAIGYDCDLALLSVQDPAFFEGTREIKIGDLPQLQDKVMVIGYPTGGSKVSITEGVVSRIELTSYAQSSRQLLAVQIDAAINPGNSGGPVLKDNKLVGIAMQVLTAGQNIGYIIPVPIIRHFFKDLEDGRYDGFPLVGIEYVNTENKALREYYRLVDHEGGVLITNILPFSPASSFLRKDDVILGINGIDIARDGTFVFRDKERLGLSYLITQMQQGEVLTLRIVRDGALKDISFPLRPFTPLVLPTKAFDQPPYYIFGGLVFTVLSVDLLKSWGNRWWEKAPADFMYYLVGTGRLNEEQNENLVVLLNVLPDDINVGYHRYRNRIITRVNGHAVRSFKDFVFQLREAKQSAYTILETRQHQRLIIPNEGVDAVTRQILRRNNIARPFPETIARWFR